MKNKASGILKQIITALTTMSKAKALAFKSKTKGIKTRLVIFSLLQNKKFLMSSISQKLNALMGQNNVGKSTKELEDDVVGGGVGDDEDDEQQSQAIVHYNRKHALWVPLPSESTESSVRQRQTEKELQTLQDDEEEEEEEEDKKYPDLTHSLFDSEEMEFERGTGSGSVIDIVKNSKEEKGEEFRLEDEIDRVADLFIRRFHRQMRLQKQLSLKRQQEISERSV